MNRKEIRVSITLADKDETFTDSDKDKRNKMSATGLRVQCNILYGYGTVMPTAQIRIYGLSLDKMMKLLRVRWNTLNALLNTIKIEVGEEGSPLQTEFWGDITFAYPDFSCTPDVCLVIESQTAIAENQKPAKSYSKKGEVDIADIFKEICSEMGYQFENNGVSIKMQDVTLNGSNLDKLKQLEHMHPIDVYIENNMVAITPRGGSRNIKIPVITPKNGLIGYPIPDVRGITFKCLYDPMLRFGGICKIQDSIIPMCNGEWRIYGLQKSLESNTPSGNWFCEVAATWRDSKDAAIAK